MSLVRKAERKYTYTDAIKDKREKKFFYEKFKVKECILLDPVEQYAEQFCLDVKTLIALEIYLEQKKFYI